MRRRSNIGGAVLNIAIVTTGDEVMAGNIPDTNATWISDRCWMLGHTMTLHMAVGDNTAAIGNAVIYAASKADVVIVSGGLGATVDDITLASAADALKLKMIYHENIWKEIQEFFDRVGRDCAENNKRQAYMPEGAKALPNKLGTAPGIWLNHNGKDYFFLPGVPKEMKYIFDNSIFPWLAKHSGRPAYFQKFLKCFGLPEATFDAMISDLKFEGINLSFRVTFPETKIKLVARSESEEESKELVAKAADKIRERLGSHVYGEDEETLEEVVGNLLISKKYNLAIAESCTGGMIANMITNVAGSSSYFERGYVTYSNESKIELLGVKPAVIKEHGAVSKETAIAMAEGARKMSKADIAVSVTGIAGSTGGTPEKPVGTVYIAIAGPKGTIVKHYIYSRERIWFKKLVSAGALDMVRRYLIEA